VRLDPETEKRIRARAQEQGDDPDEAVAEAQRLLDAEPGRPPLERLQPFLPFIKVHELREHWLGLSDRMADDELSCSTFLAQHAPPPAKTVSAKPSNDSGNGQRPQEQTNGSSTATDASATPAKTGEET
jgi:hypothetical protein